VNSRNSLFMVACRQRIAIACFNRVGGCVKAVVLFKNGEPPRIEDCPIPRLGVRDILVQVKAAGICHTDLGIIDGHVPVGTLPMIMGHEVAGLIVEKGTDVPKSVVGKRVCISYGVVCGKCAQCEAGNDTLCDHWETLGRTVNGGFSEFMAAPAENAIFIPSNVSYEEAAIIPCSVATAYHAVRRAEIGASQKVAVLGVGGLGLNAIQFLHSMNAEILAVDVLKEKLNLASSLGASWCIDASEEDPVKVIRALTGGRGADRVLEFAGTPETYLMSVESVKRGGKIVIAGFCPELMKISALRLMLDEVTITGAHSANKSEIRDIVSMLSEKRIDLKPMVTHKVSFQNIFAGFQRLRTQEGNPIRIVVTF
jgi:propanol-preferring alcohol dehydrogenase